MTVEEAQVLIKLKYPDVWGHLKSYFTPGGIRYGHTVLAKIRFGEIEERLGLSRYRSWSVRWLEFWEIYEQIEWPAERPAEDAMPVIP